MTFEQSLAFGQIGEGYIARWLRRNGYHVLPVYEKEIDNGKGPRLFMAKTAQAEQLIAPDLLALRDGRFLWVEAKRKTRFTWYGKARCFTTGIDIRHYHDYCAIARETSLAVWLLFLHVDGTTWPQDVARFQAPPTCPTGLFGNELSILQTTVNHLSDRHGRSGMVYWRVDSLRRLASLEEICGKA